MAMQRLKESAEKAKIELSSAQETEINLPFITADASGPKHMNLRLSRPKLEQLVDELIQRSITPCRQALKDAGIETSAIDEVVLVGGQTRMPAIQKAVAAFFGKEPNKGVNPDEVVAVGAAIQGGVLAGDVKDMLLLDVTPLSLGIETLGGVFTKLIERNTTIPTRKSETFSTAADNQTSVEVHVLQGEREMARDNRTLGKFHLIGIPPAPRGMPKVEVTFDIDANGIAHVSAKDLGTGKEQKITITASSGLSDSDIDRMVKEADSHRSEDQERRQKVEARNKLDSLVYDVQKNYDEHKEKLDAAQKGQIEEALTSARQALESEDRETLEKAFETLGQASHKLAELMYQTGQAGGQPGAGPGAGAGPAGAQPASDEVIDAEYVDVNK
jgi:molecular chaperone DnaK